jgi:hypothetical protein
VGGEGNTPGLLTPEITSDVISDKEYEVDKIQLHTTVDAHQEHCWTFEFEGVKPFYHHEMVSYNPNVLNGLCYGLSGSVA